MTSRAGIGRGLFRALELVIERVTQGTDLLSASVCAFLIAVTTLSVIIYQMGIIIIWLAWLGITIAWLDDLLRMLLIWLVYLGTVSLCFDNDHISMDVIYIRLPKPARKFMDVIIALIGIGLCGFIAKIGYDNMRQEFDYGMLLPGGYLPSWPQTLAIPLCFGLMTVAYLSYLFSVITGRRKRQISEEEKMAEGV
jgi:C4-dicarboxylate transporter DctQ subunit